MGKHIVVTNQDSTLDVFRKDSDTYRHVVHIPIAASIHSYEDRKKLALDIAEFLTKRAEGK